MNNRRSLNAPAPLGGDATLLATIIAKHSLLPHPNVVIQFSGPIFASVRGNRLLGQRGTVANIEGQNVVLDDNTTPRWALLVAHGYGPSIPSKARGWSLAHVWEVAQCAASYTQLANLALVPLRLSSLTDGDGAAAAYLRFHAWETYGWSPPRQPPPLEPIGYRDIRWNYLEQASNAQDNITKFLCNSSNDWACKLRKLRNQD